MVVNLPETSKLMELSSSDELMEILEEDPEEDLKEDPELGKHQANHGIKDAKSGMSDNSFGSGEELRNKFDSYYDLFRDC